MVLLMGSILTMTACGDDDEGPAVLTIESMTATGTDIETGNQTTVDLNAATAGSDVPLDAVITIEFSRDVDESTVSSSSVTISDGTTTVPATVSANGSTVTVTPTAELERGTDYTININESLRAADGGTFVSTSRMFDTAGRADVDPPHATQQVAYWTLNGHVMDVEDGFDAGTVTAITYTTDRFGQIESAASFDGDASLIEIPGAAPLLNTDDFTVSFWIKSDGSDVNDAGATRGQFVMGLAGWHGFQVEIFPDYGGMKMAAQYQLSDGTTASQDLWWSTTGNTDWQGWTFDQDVSGAGGLAAILEDKWAHVLMTYDATTKEGSIYINGILRKRQDFDLYGEGHPMTMVTGMAYAGNTDPSILALGFIQGSENRTIMDDWANPVGFPDNNHYNGLMDDVRIFHAAFSEEDVQALYNAEKP